jgi:uncharacterized DUF497 family protein
MRASASVSRTGAAFNFPLEAWEDERQADDAARHCSLAWLSGEVVYLVWTERAGEIHVISCRKEIKHETECYFKTFFGAETSATAPECVEDPSVNSKKRGKDDLRLDPRSFFTKFNPDQINGLIRRPV